MKGDLEVMTVVMGGITKSYVQISADRRRSTFNGEDFSESIEEWANKIIQLSDHIVLTALGDVDATDKGKEGLMQALKRNPNQSVKELIKDAESIFREALMERKKEYADKLHNNKSIIDRIFFKKKPLEDIQVNAAYLIGGFDLNKKETFLYLFGNDDNYKAMELEAANFLALGECMTEIAGRLEGRLNPSTNLTKCKRVFETEIKFAASQKESVNTNIYHCTITKNGITFSENPPKPKK